MTRAARVLLACMTLALSSCGSSKKAGPEESPSAQAFQGQVTRFIGAGTETGAKASQGVGYGELKQQIVTTSAAHDLMLARWPENFAVVARDDFNRAVEGWKLGLGLWELKLSNGDNPTAPDVNGYARYLEYGLAKMRVDGDGERYLYAGSDESVRYLWYGLGEMQDGASGGICLSMGYRLEEAGTEAGTEVYLYRPRAAKDLAVDAANATCVSLGHGFGTMGFDPEAETALYRAYGLGKEGGSKYAEDYLQILYSWYGLGEMEVERHAANYLVKSYRGKSFLPFDVNVLALMKLAGTSFVSGREKILNALEEESGSD